MLYPHQLSIFGDHDERLGLDHYQELAAQTDRNPRRDIDGLVLPLLGLFGEVGSLLSELKKKQRDADSYAGYELSVIEELGDVLWYFANIATRAGVKLSILAQRLSRGHSDWDEVQPDAALNFATLQPDLAPSGRGPAETFETGVIRLAGKVGRLLDDFEVRRFDDNRDLLSGHLLEILRALIAAASDAAISLGTAAAENLEKTWSRWPPEKRHPPLFDESFPPEEQLPRTIRMEISERTVAGRTYVIQRCNQINIGDRLTDNKAEEDDYRFHDVFHLAYAAVLGWSPVTRTLFRVKRKSDPKVDETEDGARAILIEEGLSTWIFNHAARLNFFENVSSLDYGLLKAVREFVQGYEVDRLPLWLWEEAILQGYGVFRELRKHRRGHVTADLNHHRITFEGMS